MTPPRFGLEKFFDYYAENEEYVTRCPECDFDYVHPEVVEINAGGLITTVTHEGSVQRQGQAEGRGVVIRLRFCCESNHRFTLKLYFHKGQTFANFEEVHKREHPDGPHTIWRD